MTIRSGALAGALVLALTAGAGAQTTISVQDQSGTVARIDPQANVIVLDDGRMVRITPSTTVFVNNRPVAYATITPGAPVVIRSGEMVTIQGGQYVVTPAPPAGPATLPAGTTVVTVPATRQVIHGRVTDVDRDGEVTIETAGGEIEVRFSPDAARTVKKGDPVQVDVTVMPPGTMPSALPR